MSELEKLLYFRAMILEGKSKKQALIELNKKLRAERQSYRLKVNELLSEGHGKLLLV